MWTDTTRAQYARVDLALPSESTDTGWALLEPFFPVPPDRATTQMSAAPNIRGDPVSAGRRAALGDVAALLSSRLDGDPLVLPVAWQ